MANGKTKQNILKASLGDYAEKGFSLVELDDIILELRFKDKAVCQFNQFVTTIVDIRIECQNYLNGSGYYGLVKAL